VIHGRKHSDVEIALREYLLLTLTCCS